MSGNPHEQEPTPTPAPSDQGTPIREEPSVAAADTHVPPFPGGNHP